MRTFRTLICHIDHISSSMSSSVKPSSFSYSLPPDFLSRPGPKATAQKVDFTKTDLPEYNGLYANIIDGALTAEECNILVRAAEARTDGKWEQAMINVGGGRQRLITDSRDCGRIIWDDRAIVEKLWSRVKDLVPEIEYLKNAPLITGNGPAKRKETWKLTRLNERMRFLRYVKGQYFRRKPLPFSRSQPSIRPPFLNIHLTPLPKIAHTDGAYATPDGQEISFYTLHLYLNGPDPTAPEGELKGGATTFHSFNERRQFDVIPKAGRVLIFQHKGLLHSGADLLGGVKLTLRTDIMFRRVDGEIGA